MPGQKAFRLIARCKGSVRRLQRRGDDFSSLCRQRAGDAPDGQIALDHSQNARVQVNLILALRHHDAGSIDDCHFRDPVESGADFGDFGLCIKADAGDSVALGKSDTAVFTATVRLPVIGPGLRLRRDAQVIGGRCSRLLLSRLLLLLFGRLLRLSLLLLFSLLLRLSLLLGLLSLLLRLSLLLGLLSLLLRLGLLLGLLSLLLRLSLLLGLLSLLLRLGLLLGLLSLLLRLSLLLGLLSLLLRLLSLLLRLGLLLGLLSLLLRLGLLLGLFGLLGGLHRSGLHRSGWLWGLNLSLLQRRLRIWICRRLFDDRNFAAETLQLIAACQVNGAAVFILHDNAGFRQINAGLEALRPAVRDNDIDACQRMTEVCQQAFLLPSVYKIANAQRVWIDCCITCGFHLAGNGRNSDMPRRDSQCSVHKGDFSDKSLVHLPVCIQKFDRLQAFGFRGICKLEGFYNVRRGIAARLFDAAFDNCLQRPPSAVIFIEVNAACAAVVGQRCAVIYFGVRVGSNGKFGDGHRFLLGPLQHDLGVAVNIDRACAVFNDGLCPVRTDGNDGGFVLVLVFRDSSQGFT